jgi:uncharacterized protein YcbX
VPKDDGLRQLNVMRFRPNIIGKRSSFFHKDFPFPSARSPFVIMMLMWKPAKVSGAPGYDEDTWKRMRLDPGTSGLYGSMSFDISCRTVRCRLPNVDPETGERHPTQPDKSLRALRNVDPSAPRSGCFGVQACPLFEDGLAEEDREGWIGVGMEVQVEERAKHS